MEEKRSGGLYPDGVIRRPIPYLPGRDDDFDEMAGTWDARGIDYTSGPNGCRYNSFWQVHGETKVMSEHT